jgi:hypothetical protein
MPVKYWDHRALPNQSTLKAVNQMSSKYSPTTPAWHPSEEQILAAELPRFCAYPRANFGAPFTNGGELAV